MRPRYLWTALSTMILSLAAAGCGWPGGLAALNPAPGFSPAPIPSFAMALQSTVPEVSDVGIARGERPAGSAALALAELEAGGALAAAAAVGEEMATQEMMGPAAVNGGPGNGTEGPPLRAAARDFTEPPRPVGGRIRLAVPFRTQKDGDRFQGSNCGPAALAMVLEAFGIERSNGELRWLIHSYQGTVGRRGGTALEHMATVGEDFGMQALGLYEGDDFSRWTVDEVVAQVERGRIVVPLVKYRLLPGHEGSPVRYDHYVVIHGVDGEWLLYHDPAYDSPHEGGAKWLTRAQLDRAMAPTLVPRQAVAFDSGRFPPLP